MATFDFSSLADESELTSISDPIQLFDALPSKSSELDYLRQVQATVLSQWAGRRNETDLVIKMNTGTGKTIVGLLVAQVSLNDGAGPALYLAPDPHLADRVAQEASRLGLDVATESSDPKFTSCEVLCVTSLQTFFNGKSRFGVSGRSDPVRLGTVIIDDAHSAVTKFEELSRMLLPVGHQAYEALLSLFEAELETQGHAKLLDIKAGDRGATLRVPFWAWQARAREVVDIIHTHRTTPQVEWTWALIKDSLHLCEAILTHEGIEIVPPLPPIEMFPSFVEARRRVYLTATLANDSVLITHFDADESSVATPIVPESAADLGDRLILAPQELLPDLSDDEIREAVAELGVTHNVVVLVPSHKRAAAWSEVQNVVASTAEQITDLVNRLKTETVGVAVIVNRYDGIDLPDDACRVLVLDGLPQVASGAERREATALRSSTAMLVRNIQRFEQGLGRGVRSRSDRCAVLLLDRRLVELVSSPDTPSRLSPGTRKQLELSRTVARRLRAGGLGREDLIELVRKVIEGHEDFKKAVRNALVGVTYETAPIVPTARPLRDAYNAAVRGDYPAAADAADLAVQAARTALGDDRLGGWLMEKAAAYRNFVDPARAQKTLSAASALNPSTLRPLSGVSHTLERPTRRQADAAAEYLTRKYSSGTELRIGIEALLSDLAWDPDRTEEAEEALFELGLHLGFASSRPEKLFGTGGDVLWLVGDDNYLVIEAKTGCETRFIAKHDVDQLGGAVRWVQETYKPSGVVLPVMVHPSRVAHFTATPPEHMRVVDQETLSTLRDAVRAYAVALAGGAAYKNVSVVQQQLTHGRLNGRQIAERYAAAVTVQRR